MITSLYTKYFQKSRTFLFPALGIQKQSDIPLVNTYVTWKDNVSVNDKKLICLYNDDQSELFRSFEQKMLQGNPLFDKQHLTKTQQGIYVFSFDSHAKDWNNFVKGRYSKFSRVLKKAVQDYYGADSAEYMYMDTYLYPDKYYDLYAKLLEVFPEVLKEVGELCDPYDPKQEELDIDEKDLENLENSTYICRP